MQSFHQINVDNVTLVLVSNYRKTSMCQTYILCCMISTLLPVLLLLFGILYVQLSTYRVKVSRQCCNVIEVHKISYFAYYIHQHYVNVYSEYIWRIIDLRVILVVFLMYSVQICAYYFMLAFIECLPGNCYHMLKQCFFLYFT